MKKNHLLFLALFMPLVAVAKEYTIKIKAKSGNPVGQTEVSISGSDTLLVTPSGNAHSITVALKDVDGSIIDEHVVPTAANHTLTFIAPELPTGYFLEVRDPRGVVYQEFTYQ